MKTKYRIVKEKFRPICFLSETERFEIQKWTPLHRSLLFAWWPIKIDGVEYYKSFESAEKALLDYQNPPKEETSVVKEYEF